MSEEQLEYSAKLLADNISLEKRNKEIYEGFIATTQELCEATKEIERLNNIINKVLFILEHLEDDRVGYEACIELLKGSDKE